MSSITIRVLSRDGKVDDLQIDAELIGAFALHLAAGISVSDGSTAFAITHLSTGNRVTPFYFESEADARAAATAILALPVDWTNRKFEPGRADDICQAVIAVSMLCNGFLIEDAMDQPTAGSA